MNVKHINTHINILLYIKYTVSNGYRNIIDDQNSTIVNKRPSQKILLPVFGGKI